MRTRSGKKGCCTVEIAEVAFIGVIERSNRIAAGYWYVGTFPIA
jgi:hypothetical protein